MRKITTLLVGLMLFAASATAAAWTDNDERQIDFKELPVAAQQFIKKHFASEQVKMVILDKDVISNEYDILFTSGTKVEFKGDGEWECVKSPAGDIPADLVPKKIASYVVKHYPTAKIVELSRNRNEWEVELNNGTELTFGSDFKLREIDD